MGERPEMRHMAEEEAKKHQPEEERSAAEDIGNMISESLADGNPDKVKADQPITDIRPLTIAEFQSSKAKRPRENEDWEKEQEVRLELDRATKAKPGIDVPQTNFEPSGLELADLQPSTKAPSERKLDVPEMRQ